MGTEEKIGEIDCSATKKYIILTTKSAAIDIYRKRTGKELVLFEEEQLEEEACTEEPVQDRVFEAIKGLKPEYAHILQLKYVHGFSNREIAALLKKREGTVRVTLSRAKKELEKKLAAWKFLRDGQNRGD
ncbi:MAG: RNA polymerase sigma factor [Lachnospiraceae bacterium]|nr:RNA polymerase sigma factor [Lachnospiraceae bacterium]